MYYSPFLRMRSKSGITIVELMLVVVVFSILAAIILPLFSRARATSYRTQCASNLRQLGIAFTNYADWNGNWPSPGGKVGNWNYWAQSGSGGLESYVRQRGVNSVWCCPMQEQWHSRYPARTYSMNSLLRDPPDRFYTECILIMRGINVGNILEPQRTILLYEGLMLTTGWENTSLYEYIYRCANWQFVRGYSPAYKNFPKTTASEKPWHGKVNNYLYCDGHIVSRPPGRCSVAQLSTYKEMYQWYVNKKQFRYDYATIYVHKIPNDPTAPK